MQLDIVEKMVEEIQKVKKENQEKLANDKDMRESHKIARNRLIKKLSSLESELIHLAVFPFS